MDKLITDGRNIPYYEMALGLAQTLLTLYEKKKPLDDSESYTEARDLLAQSLERAEWFMKMTINSESVPNLPS